MRDYMCCEGGKKMGCEWATQKTLMKPELVGEQKRQKKR